MAQFDVMIIFSLIFNLLLVLYMYYAHNIQRVILIYVETKKFRNKISSELNNVKTIVSLGFYTSILNIKYFVEGFVYIGSVILFYLFIFAIFSNKKKIKEYASKFSNLLKLSVPFIYSITTVYYYKFLTHLFHPEKQRKLEKLSQKNQSFKTIVKKNKSNKILSKNSLRMSKRLELYLSRNFLYTQTVSFGTDSRKQEVQNSKKSSLIKKIYIYLLYEYFILKTYYVSRLFFMLYAFGIFFVNYDYIVQASFLDSVIFILITTFVWNMIFSSVLFPYLIFIPGDGSKMEEILTNSELPHAKLLVEFKQSNKF